MTRTGPSVAVLAVSCALLGCGSSGDSSQTSSAPTSQKQGGSEVEYSTLSLQRSGDGVVLHHEGPSSDGPRMMDVRIEWAGGWTLQGHDAGAAALAAEKTVQVLEASDSGARIVVMATDNTNTIGSGEIVKLELEGGQAGTIDIVPVPPVLAPAESEEGLRLGAPLSL